MQTYPQYYPQMNNYGQQYNPQQPYMDRLAGLQQYQQTLQQPQMQIPKCFINSRRNHIRSERERWLDSSGREIAGKNRILSCSIIKKITK